MSSTANDRVSNERLDRASFPSRPGISSDPTTLVDSLTRLSHCAHCELLLYFMIYEGGESLLAVTSKCSWGAQVCKQKFNNSKHKPAISSVFFLLSNYMVVVHPFYIMELRD